ncbi:f-box-like domain-containing protein [Ditylenchus destructor]|nr:f-box-like domain-containing protein [Ditylenchus destructor]
MSSKEKETFICQKRPNAENELIADASSSKKLPRFENETGQSTSPSRLFEAFEMMTHFQCKRDDSTKINDLPNVNLAQIFEMLPWQDRLKIEQVCKKWHCVGKNLSWSNYRYFNNSRESDWPEERVTEVYLVK